MTAPLIERSAALRRLRQLGKAMTTPLRPTTTSR